MNPLKTVPVKNLAAFCSFIFLLSVTSNAQLVVTSSRTATILSSALAGPGITITSPVLTCPANANGTFTVTPGTILGTGVTAFGINSGIMLTTGRAVSAAGTEPTLASTNNGAAGDAALTSLAGATTYDACILEFDVTPVGDTLKFNYQFGSEEYNHSTCGPYNDAFAFYISGPGIIGTQNMALVPGTTIPVTVNSVNSGIPGAGYTLANCTAMGLGSPFTTYFVDNTGGSYFTYKGFTAKLTAKSHVTPCATYHLKLTIADAGNSFYDSGVFIEQGSLTTPSITGITTVCIGGTTTLSYSVAGGTWSSSAPSVATVGTSTGVVIGVAAGTATITYTYGVGCAATTTVTVVPAPSITGTTSVCAGSTATLSASTTGGTWSSSNTSIATVGSSTGVVTGVAADTVTIFYAISTGCVSSTVFTVNSNPAPIAGPLSICVGAAATLTDASGGGSWSSSAPAIATIGTASGVVNGISAGTSTITYTLGTGCSTTATVSVNAILTNTVNAAICNGASYSFGGSTYTSSGTYTHTFPTAHCDSVVTLNLTVHPVSVTLITDSICDGQSYTLGPNTYTASGTYTYLAANIYGCDSTVTLHLFVKPVPPVPDVASPVVYCQGQSAVPLRATGQNLLWYNVSAGGTGGSIALIPSTAAAGTFYYYVSQTVNGCDSRRGTITVNILPVPVASIMPDKTILCSKDTLSLSAGLQPGVSYLWSLPRGASIESGSASYPGPIQVRFDSAGNYYVKLTITAGSGICSTTDSALLHVIVAPELTFYSKPEVCVGDTVLVALTSITPGITDFAWNLGDATLINATEAVDGGPYNVTWHTAGVHYITSYGTIGQCRSKLMIDSIDVVALPAPKITGTLSGVCEGDSVTFSTPYVPGDMYEWAPQHFFQNTNTADIYGRILAPGNSIVTVTETTPIGCKATDSVLVSAQACCAVSFPNAFAPDAIGVDRIFKPITDGHHLFHMFRIYNRWGQTVFETSNDRDGWDGRFNGVPQDMGVYYYFVKYDCEGHTVEQKGEVTLIR